MQDHHVLPISTYLKVFGALMGLTALTTWIAFQDLGVLNTPVALAIAIFKVAVVVLWFMHVKYSSRLVWIAAAAGAYWLLILFAFTLGDYLTRPQIQGWLLDGPY